MQGISHMMSEKDPATTIDPVMTSCQHHMQTCALHWRACGQSSRLHNGASAQVSLCLVLRAVYVCCALGAALAVYSLLFARWALAVSP